MTPEFTQTLTAIRDLTSNLIAIPAAVLVLMVAYSLLLRRAAR